MAERGDPGSRLASSKRASAAPFSRADLARAGYSLEGYSPARSAPGGAAPRAPRPEVQDPDAVVFRKERSGKGGHVVGMDDRWPVLEPTAPPFRHICKLVIKSAEGRSYMGTGWLVGPRTVITAGHCLYLPDEGGLVAEVRVFPAMAGDVAPYDSRAGEKILPSEGWMRGAAGERELHDYGAVWLEAPGFPGAGSFGFGAATQAGLAAARINIAGYPADLGDGRRQYFHGRPVGAVLEHQIQYDVDTFAGQSGSPIWVDVGGVWVAVGIHTVGSVRYNRGVRITEGVFHDILRWKRGQDGGF